MVHASRDAHLQRHPPRVPCANLHLHPHAPHQCPVFTVPLVHLHAHQHLRRVTIVSGLRLLSPGPWHVLIFVSFSEKYKIPGWKALTRGSFLFAQINSLSHHRRHLRLLSFSNTTHAIYLKILLALPLKYTQIPRISDSFHHNRRPLWSRLPSFPRWIIAKPCHPTPTLAQLQSILHPAASVSLL